MQLSLYLFICDVYMKVGFCEKFNFCYCSVKLKTRKKMKLGKMFYLLPSIDFLIIRLIGLKIELCQVDFNWVFYHLYSVQKWFSLKRGRPLAFASQRVRDQHTSATSTEQTNKIRQSNAVKFTSFSLSILYVK